MLIYRGCVYRKHDIEDYRGAARGHQGPEAPQPPTPYHILLTRAARKGLAKLHPDLRQKATSFIDGLVLDPKPHNVKKLSNRHHQWQNYLTYNDRIVYLVYPDINTVVLIYVGPKEGLNYRTLPDVPFDQLEGQLFGWDDVRTATVLNRMAAPAANLIYSVDIVGADNPALRRQIENIAASFPASYVFDEPNRYEVWFESQDRDFAFQFLDELEVIGVDVKNASKRLGSTHQAALAGRQLAVLQEIAEDPSRFDGVQSNSMRGRTVKKLLDLGLLEAGVEHYEKSWRRPGEAGREGRRFSGFTVWSKLKLTAAGEAALNRKEASLRRHASTLMFESPVLIYAENEYGDGDELDVVPNDVCSALREAIIDEMQQLGPEGLAQWGGPAESIKMQIACSRYGQPTAQFIVQMDRDDPESIKKLTDYLAGQLSDGWGEGYEQRPFFVDDYGVSYSASFWFQRGWELRRASMRHAVRDSRTNMENQATSGIDLMESALLAVDEARGHAEATAKRLDDDIAISNLQNVARRLREALKLIHSALELYEEYDYGE